MDDEVKLLPCLRCGGSAHTSQAGDVWFVHCDNKDCLDSHSDFIRDEAEAIAAWNTRPSNPDAVKLAEELERLAAKATAGPWEVDSEYDSDAGYHNFFIGGEVRGKWATLFDSVNSDEKLIEDERGDEGGRAWDAVGEGNAHLVVALVNNLPAILAALRQPYPAPDVERDELAWLIEFPESGDIYKHGKRVGPGTPLQYFCAIPKGRGVLARTEDPNLALRFARKIDAEAMLARLDSDSVFQLGVPTGGYVAEHMWCAPPPEAITALTGDTE